MTFIVYLIDGDFDYRVGFPAKGWGTNQRKATGAAPYWGVPMAGSWIDPHLGFEDGERRPFGAFMGGFGAIYLPDETRKIIEPVFGDSGEFLPTTVAGEKRDWWSFHVTVRRPIIDHDNSELTTDSRRSRYQFDVAVLSSCYLVRDEVSSQRLFSVESEDRAKPGFKAFCEDKGLTGLSFYEVWDGGG